MSATPPTRSTYRHGDLRRALLDAGIEMARDGGPDAVVLREATRRVGVAPNAAYRHFADRQALLDAVCSAAQATLADAMECQLAVLPPAADDAAAARARLRAVGTGYLSFAVAEPGLFRTAFSVPADLSTASSPDKRGGRDRAPLEILTDVLDEMVKAGALAPQRRPRAEFLAWSAVHGLATLLIDGPLRAFGSAGLGDLGTRLLDMVEKGL
ncbi:TetR family transcriptional regulator [Catellatospora sp. TT07R-123]|uniref:TetR/AcrR family transcriptional regulator n=1 Tax=Catellatospora sp. TT07R-123 TaxID=2733863 RepID=UPI001B2D5C04|nr:TetR/AcrR family transcriptional regulator [Catellatospora sp. TT07R-123]GHJ44214.1 TetR family transcriptional regulator [Catellatospora sp. TT07R-123]